MFLLAKTYDCLAMPGATRTCMSTSELYIFFETCTKKQKAKLLHSQILYLTCKQTKSYKEQAHKNIMLPSTNQARLMQHNENMVFEFGKHLIFLFLIVIEFLTIFLSRELKILPQFLFFFFFQAIISAELNNTER